MLIDAFCPVGLVQGIKDSDANRDCLIRVYLGRRRHGAARDRPSRFQAFSLRNFPLHIDQMERLGISMCDMEIYARSMAGALAMMHWHSNIDGKDVGVCPCSTKSREQR